MEFLFTKIVIKQLSRLPGRDASRIREKLLFWQSNSQLLAIQLREVVGMEFVTHRLRVGNWRVLLQVDKSKQFYLILKIASRKEVYQ